MSTQSSTLLRPPALRQPRLLPPRPRTRLEDLVDRVSARWKLTERQRRVLHLVARGKANKQVADLLGISERTVEIHVHNITLRACLQGRSELLAALLRAALDNRTSVVPSSDE